MCRKFFVVIGSILILTSCKFSKPILCIRHFKKVSVDSVTHYRADCKVYYFLCLRHGIHIGDVRVNKEYDIKGRLIEKMVNKTINALIVDGDNWYFEKTTTYDSKGYKIRDVYYIDRTFDLAPILRDTVNYSSKN